MMVSDTFLLFFLTITSVVFLVLMNRWMVRQGFPKPVRWKVTVILAVVAALMSLGLMWVLRLYVEHQDMKMEREIDAKIVTLASFCSRT
ncbi:hypothetical protein FOA19_16235 [Rufibacter hautae]|uniref:Uncharacterized protein n=1 Tax=Rufibacter hautae TaxID=2595005 RepID=A0A5B6TQR2_9BACT|nr:hypothetical protein FOA19_16235 [Rufibacter hautae]